MIASPLTTEERRIVTSPFADLTTGSTEADVAELDQLERTYAPPRGPWGWITSVDHKSIAKRYIVTAFVFFILAGLNAVLMRLQLSQPETHLVGPDRYNQLFTVHGTAMMFLFAVPVMTAMGLYLVPLMVGTRDVVYPRLNAFGYWFFLIGGIFLFVSFSFLLYVSCDLAIV